MAETEKKNVNRSVTPLRSTHTSVLLTSEQEERIMRKTHESLKKERLDSVRKQEKMHSEKVVQKYKDELKKKENLEMNAAMYEHYMQTKQEYERLKREKETILELKHKAQRDAIAKAEEAEQAAKLKAELTTQYKQDAEKRWVDAMRKQKEEAKKRIEEAEQAQKKRKEVLDKEVALAKERAAQYRETVENMREQEFDLEELKQIGLSKRSGLKKKDDYTNTRYHNTLIVRHEDLNAPNATEKARLEIQKQVEKMATMKIKTHEILDKAKERGGAALDRVNDEKELEELEKELKTLKKADNKLKIEEGKKKDAVTLQMPHTLEQNHKRAQKEVEKFFEDEFLEGNRIDFADPMRAEAEPQKSAQGYRNGVEMRIINKEDEKVMVDIPQTISSEEEKVPIAAENEPVRDENNSPSPQKPFVDEGQEDVVQTNAMRASPGLPEADRYSPQYRAPSPPAQFHIYPSYGDAPIYAPSSVPPAMQKSEDEPEAETSPQKIESPEKEQPAKITSVLQKEKVRVNVPPAPYQAKTSSFLKDFLNEPPVVTQSPVIKENRREEESPESESLISSGISSQKSPLTMNKYNDPDGRTRSGKKEEQARSDLNYSPTESPEAEHPEENLSPPKSGVLCLDESAPESKPLSEAFKARKPKIVAKLEHQKNEPKKTTTQKRTKEDILEQRKKMMKSTVPHGRVGSTTIPEEECESSEQEKSKDQPTALLRRLAEGKKLEVKIEDYHK